MCAFLHMKTVPALHFFLPPFRCLFSLTLDFAFSLGIFPSEKSEGDIFLLLFFFFFLFLYTKFCFSNFECKLDMAMTCDSDRYYLVFLHSISSFLFPPISLHSFFLSYIHSFLHSFIQEFAIRVWSYEC